jgi:hypothetical protein
VTELVYRHQIRPVLDEGATAMDSIFTEETDDHREKDGAG